MWQQPGFLAEQQLQSPGRWGGGAGIAQEARLRPLSPGLSVPCHAHGLEPQHKGWGLGGGVRGSPGESAAVVGGTRVGRAGEKGEGCPEQQNQSLAGMEVQHEHDAKFRTVAEKHPRVLGLPAHAGHSLRYPSCVRPAPQNTPCACPTAGAAKFTLVLWNLSPSTTKKR